MCAKWMIHRGRRRRGDVSCNHTSQVHLKVDSHQTITMPFISSSYHIHRKTIIIASLRTAMLKTRTSIIKKKYDKVGKQNKKSRAKAGIKWHIRSILKCLEFQNLRRCELCGVLQLCSAFKFRQKLWQNLRRFDMHEQNCAVLVFVAKLLA